MAAFETLPTFYDSAGQFLSKTDLNLLRTNVGLIDRWTYRSEAAFDSSTGVDTNTPLYYQAGTPMRIWWGAARYVAGCTTLTVEGFGKQSSAENIKVYVNGTDVSGSGTLAITITLPTGTAAAFSGSWTVSGLTDGQIVPIEVRVEGAHTTTASYEITDIYFSSISKSGWPGVPTFTTSSVNAANLNQLCTATQWVYDRMRLVPMTPRLGLFYNLGPFFDPSRGDPQHTDRPMYYGSIGRYYSNQILRIAMTVQSITTPGWLYKIYLNDTLVETSATYGIGQQPFYRPFSLSSYALGSRVRIKITASSTNGGTADPLRRTRWTFPIVRGEPDGSGWGYASLPAAFVGPATSTTTWSTVVSNLNSLATIVSNAKSRIDGRPELWARSRAMRRYYNRDDSHDIQQARARPYFPRRTGSELYVKGAGVELNWGVITPGTLDAEDNGWEKYSFGAKQSISDSATGQLIYLDDLKGLDMGSAYTAFGDPLYLAEYIA
jgi:hypothetical protein